MDVCKTEAEKWEREREREKKREGKIEEEEVQIKDMEFKRSKNIKFSSHNIKFSSHKSNLTAREKWFYIFAGLFEYIKGASKIH